MKKLMSLTLLAMLVIFQFVSVIPANASDASGDFVRDVRMKTQQGNLVDENSPPVDAKEAVTLVYTWGNLANMTPEKDITLNIPNTLKVEKQQIDLVSLTNEHYGSVTVNPDKQEINIRIDKEIPSFETGTFEILAKLNNEKKQDEMLVTLNTGKNSKQARVPMKAQTKLTTLKSAITTNILTSVELTDINGKAFTEENRPSVDSTARIAFEWALPDALNVKAGDTYSFQLPEIFSLYSKVTGTLGDYGTFVAETDGTVTMTFNENVELDSNVAGTLQFNTGFNVNQKDTPTTQTVNFPVAEQDGYELHFVPKSGAAVTKSGAANQAYSPDGLNWTVRVNGKEDVLRNAVLKDTLPAGLTLDADSIEVYRLNVFMDGSAQLDGLADATEYTVVSGAGRTLEIQFADGNSTAYEVRYKTTIEDVTKTSFKNAAEFTNNDVKATTSATIAIKRGDHLKKRGTFDPKTERVKWTISYNFDGKTVAEQDAILHDLFDNEHQLVDGSIVVRNVTVDKDGKAIIGAIVPATDYQVTPTSTSTQNGFDLQFTDGISTAYEVTYETKLSDTTTNLTTVTNNVETPNTPKESATVSVDSQNITKQLVDSDYSTKTMNWAQQINTNQYSLDNAVIRDTFASGGLTLLPETLKLIDQDANNKTLIEGTDYSITSDTNGFVITLLNGYATDMTHTLNLTYSTHFQFEAIKSGTAIKNDTRLEWGATDEKRTSTDTTNTDLDYYTQKNGFKLGAYDAQSKEITWTIGFNYNLLTINEPILKDVIPSSQTLLPDTIEVHKMELGKEAYNYSDGGIVDPANYTLDTSNNTVRVAFNKPITEAYYITFKTSIADKLVVPTYLNAATLYDGNTEQTTVTGFVNVPNGGNYVNKTGVQNGDNINWEVTINAGQSTIANAKITDTPQSNQILLPDTIKLYSTKIQKNGAITQGQQLLPDKDYTLTIHTDGETGNQSFEIAFTDTIHSAYIMKYDTYIDAGDKETVRNNVKLTGDNLTTEQTSTSSDVIVRFSEGSGGASAERGTLTIRKIDTKTTKSLQGAEFGLYNKDGTVLLRTSTTNESGDITFPTIRYGDYLVKELTAPTGYFKSDNSESGITFKMDQKEALLVVENDQFVGEATLTKTETGTTNRLAGAIFDLVQGDQVIQTGLTTDENGEIRVTDLTPGDYTFIETSAPTGYQLDPTPHTFTITEKQTEPAQVTAENNLILGTLIITKQDTTTKQPLSGATFEIQDTSGNIIQSSLTTDFEGKITITDLPLGDYNLIETTAPTDYQLDSTPIPVTITKATSTENIHYLTVDNTLITGSVTLTKLDSENPEITLQGATFDLQDNEGNTIATNLATDTTGQITITDLLPGDYTFIETSAPTGYQLDPTPIPFTIEKSQSETLHLEVTNIKTKAPDPIPDNPTTPDNPVITPTTPSNPTPTNPIPSSESHTPTIPTQREQETPIPVSTSLQVKALPTVELATSKSKSKPSTSESNLPETGDNSSELPIWLGTILIISALYLGKRKK
ncbi:LPXTG cell wall anchor domain-containing protein [Listeria booriae]|uniref:LPXTG cell wall anchor domain-containing protein n=1 Tax=Listeria booriae TaxID=1552123 RepID=A0A841YKJ6_9LIST|nr:LPXTG cell wall anchor domain-containing protein [Listeria booriae]MBC1400693.1 LPXTG cell wall anchor domain-containing protein [Listeria booriae]MBC1616540.1 LPXTG cell wall anchor domain-containing protein [Listeria booriae]